MNEQIINLEYNGATRAAVVTFNFIGGYSGNSTGAPESCFEGNDNEYELEKLEIKFGDKWLNKTSAINFFESDIVEELENKLRCNNDE